MRDICRCQQSGLTQLPSTVNSSNNSPPLGREGRTEKQGTVCTICILCKYRGEASPDSMLQLGEGGSRVETKEGEHEGENVR